MREHSAREGKIKLIKARATKEAKKVAEKEKRGRKSPAGPYLDAIHGAITSLGDCNGLLLFQCQAIVLRKP